MTESRKRAEQERRTLRKRVDRRTGRGNSVSQEESQWRRHFRRSGGTDFFRGKGSGGIEGREEIHKKNRVQW